MIELLILISGVVFLWRFGPAIGAFATGTETKAKVYAEEIVKDAALERADNYADWKQRSQGKVIPTHEQFMGEMLGTTQVEVTSAKKEKTS